MFFFALWIAVQVILESLPISSSTHVHLFEKWLVAHEYGDFLLLIPPYVHDLMHMCTLCVLAFFYRRRWMPLARDLLFMRTYAINAFFRTAWSSMITVGFYFFWDVIQPDFSYKIGLFLTMCLLLSLYWWVERNERYTLWHATVLGIVQGVALLPGISRLASTYTVLVWMGISARHAFQASFAAQVPLIIAAVVRASYYAYTGSFFIQLLQPAAVLSMLISMVCAYGALTWVVRRVYVQLWWFGVYVGLLLCM